MPYQTRSYHMIASQFYNEAHAAVHLLTNASDTILEKLNLKAEAVETFLDDGCCDPNDLEDILGVWPGDVINTFGLGFAYEGDARFDVPHGYLGLSFTEMKDDETKKQFISRVERLVRSDVSEVYFSYTC